jgi:nitrogen fixation/metabolism regulation signal transduction histidine kinase
MDAVLLYLLLTIIIDGCSAIVSTYGHGSGTSGSSGSSTLTTIIVVATVVPIVVVLVILGIVLFCCIKKYIKRSTTGVLPTQTQMAMMQQENQYAPPPYGQSPYYSPFNDPTKTTFA